MKGMLTMRRKIKIKQRDGRYRWYIVEKYCGAKEYAKLVSLSYNTVLSMCTDHTLPAWKERDLQKSHWRIAITYKALDLVEPVKV